jgi:hypothetical protein
VAFVVDLTDVDPTLGVVEVVAVDGVVYVACDHLARSLGASTRWISARGSVDDVVGVAMIDPVRWLDPRSDATDVEVGDDGLVRSITMRFDSDREGGSAVVSVQYLDVGIPVRINPPPPTDVTDVTGALGG